MTYALRLVAYALLATIIGHLLFDFTVGVFILAYVVNLATITVLVIRQGREKLADTPDLTIAEQRELREFHEKARRWKADTEKRYNI